MGVFLQSPKSLISLLASLRVIQCIEGWVCVCSVLRLSLLFGAIYWPKAPCGFGFFFSDPHMSIIVSGFEEKKSGLFLSHISQPNRSNKTTKTEQHNTKKSNPKPSIEM